MSRVCVLSFLVYSIFLTSFSISEESIDSKLKNKFIHLGKDFRFIKDVPWAAREQEIACVWLKAKDPNVVCEVNDRNFVEVLAELIELIRRHPKFAKDAVTLNNALSEYKKEEDSFIEFYSVVKMSEYKENKDIMDYIGPAYFKVSFLPTYYSDMGDAWFNLKERLLKIAIKLFS